MAIQHLEEFCIPTLVISLCNFKNLQTEKIKIDLKPCLYIL